MSLTVVEAMTKVVEADPAAWDAVTAVASTGTAGYIGKHQVEVVGHARDILHQVEAGACHPTALGFLGVETILQAAEEQQILPEVFQAELRSSLQYVADPNQRADEVSQATAATIVVLATQ